MRAFSIAGIEFAEEDKVLRAYSASQPNDPDLPQQWAMFQLGLFTPDSGASAVLASASAAAGPGVLQTSSIVSGLCRISLCGRNM